jgi:hypothetical protein
VSDFAVGGGSRRQDTVRALVEEASSAAYTVGGAGPPGGKPGLHELTVGYPFEGDGVVGESEDRGVSGEVELVVRLVTGLMLMLMRRPSGRSVCWLGER